MHHLVHSVRRRPDGLVYVEYSLWDSRGDFDANRPRRLIAGHVMDIPDTFRQVVEDAAGRYKLRTGQFERPEDVEDLPPSAFERETVVVDRNEWVARYIGIYARTAVRRDLSGDRRGTIVTIRVAPANNDDASHNSAHGYSLGSNDERLGSFGGNFHDYWGLYRSTTIPQAATINAAKVVFFAADTDTGTGTDVDIDVEDADHGSTPLDDTAYHNVVLTGSPVAWDDVADWTDNTENDSDDFASPLQTVVNRAGFGGDVHVRFDSTTGGTSTNRRKYDHERSDATKTLIEVDYTAGIGAGEISGGLAGPPDNPVQEPVMTPY